MEIINDIDNPMKLLRCFIILFFYFILSECMHKPTKNIVDLIHKRALTGTSIDSYRPWYAYLDTLNEPSFRKTKELYKKYKELSQGKKDAQLQLFCSRKLKKIHVAPLVYAGANPNVQEFNCCGKTPLHEICTKSSRTSKIKRKSYQRFIKHYTTLISLLLAQGADPNILDGSVLPLHSIEDPELAHLLLRWGSKTDLGLNLIHHAIMHRGFANDNITPLVQIYINANVSLTWKISHGHAPRGLHTALTFLIYNIGLFPWQWHKQSISALTSCLLRAGIDPNFKTNDYYYPNKTAREIALLLKYRKTQIRKEESWVNSPTEPYTNSSLLTHVNSAILNNVVDAFLETLESERKKQITHCSGSILTLADLSNRMIGN